MIKGGQPPPQTDVGRGNETKPPKDAQPPNTKMHLKFGSESENHSIHPSSPWDQRKNESCLMRRVGVLPPTFYATKDTLARLLAEDAWHWTCGNGGNGSTGGSPRWKQQSSPRDEEINNPTGEGRYKLFLVFSCPSHKSQTWVFDAQIRSLAASCTMAPGTDGFSHPPCPHPDNTRTTRERITTYDGLF